jgi:hypothetical protein
MELVKAVAISSGLVMQLLYRIGHQSGLTKRTFVLLASSFSVHYCKETVIDQQLGKLDAIVHLFPAPKSINLLGTICFAVSAISFSQQDDQHQRCRQ